MVGGVNGLKEREETREDHEERGGEDEWKTGLLGGPVGRLVNGFMVIPGA